LRGRAEMSPASQQEAPGGEIPSSRIYVDLDQLSSRQHKTVLGLIKEMGFSKEEVGELVIKMGEKEVTGSE
jgi:hypothetical protein